MEGISCHVGQAAKGHYNVSEGQWVYKTKEVNKQTIKQNNIVAPVITNLDGAVM